jgi:hypothetical protein
MPETTSTILKEAIADAKAVRQTALANAKAALEEAFGSRLEAMFAPKLDEETAEENAATGGLPGVAAAPEEGAVHEADIAEIIRELEADLPHDDASAGAPAPGLGAPGAAPMGGAPVPAPAPGLGSPDMAAPHVDIPIPPAQIVGAPGAAPMGGAPVPPSPDMGAGAPVGNEPVAPEAPAEPSAEKDEEMDEEIDISELLESLKHEEEEEEEEMDESVKKEEEDEEMDETIKEQTKLNASGVGGHKAGGSANKKPSSASSSSSKVESGAGSVDSATVGTPGAKKVSSKDATVGSKRPNQADHATKDHLSTPNAPLKEDKMSDLGVDGGTTTCSGKDATTGVDRPNQADHATKDNLSTPKLAKENAELRKELAEAKEGVTYLHKQLNEINLLNAKLLYTNKLFKNYAMDNGKKMKIVEMFDIAKNVREVKMTYTVIAESLNFGADFKKVLPSKVQKITEGMASQPVAGTAPKQIITEGARSDMVQKFQRLAGIPAQKQQPKK